MLIANANVVEKTGDRDTIDARIDQRDVARRERARDRLSWGVGSQALHQRRRGGARGKRGCARRGEDQACELRPLRRRQEWVVEPDTLARIILGELALDAARAGVVAGNLLVRPFRLDEGLKRVAYRIMAERVEVEAADFRENRELVAFTPGLAVAADVAAKRAGRIARAGLLDERAVRLKEVVTIVRRTDIGGP